METLTLEQKELVKATVPVLRESGVALTDYFYKRMLSNNPYLKETFNMGHQRDGAQARALAGSVLAYAENIDDPSVLAPVIELIAHKHVSLNIQAPDYSIVGENLLHSISEVLTIPMEDKVIKAWAVAYGQLADILISSEQTIYHRHMATKGSWLGWRNFVVQRKVKENDDVFSFYLVPQDGKDIPLYQGGQYISVRVPVPELGLKQPRQYSLSDCANREYFRISVKCEDGRVAGQDPGYVSSTLHRDIKEGDIVEVSAPTGNFYLLNPAKKNVLISAGIGITPMIAMLNQLVTAPLNADSSTSQNPIYFLHATRSIGRMAIGNQLRELAEKNPDFHLYIACETVTPADIQGKDFNQAGRLDLTRVPSALLPPDADYYLCGPMPFMQEQNNALLALCIPQQHIHSEAFNTGGVQL